MILIGEVYEYWAWMGVVGKSCWMRSPGTWGSVPLDSRFAAFGFATTLGYGNMRAMLVVDQGTESSIM